MNINSQNTNRITKNTAVLYLRSFFLMIINLYTSRIVLQALGVDDFGIYTVIGGVVSFFGIISGTLSAASQRFITYALGENDKEKQKRVFSNSLTLHIILGLIVIILLEIVGVWALYNQLNIPIERIVESNVVLQCSILTLFFGMLSVPFNALIIAYERMSAFAYISILEGVLKLLIAVCLLYVGLDKLVLFAILHLLVSVLLNVIYAIYSRCNFDESRNISFHIDKVLFKHMFSFAGWNMIGQGSMILRNQGIDILLNIFFGVAINAAKGVSNQVQAAVNQFVGNFSTSIGPQLTMSVAQKNYARTHSLIYHGSRLYFFMMMIFTIPLMVSAREVLSLWLVEVPEWTVAMVVLSLFYVQSNTLSRLLINSILAHGEIRNFQILAGGTKLLALPVALLFLGLGGNPLTGIWVNIVLDFCCRCIELFFTHKLLYYNIKKNLVHVECMCWLTYAIAFILSSSFYVCLSSNIVLSILVSLFVSATCIWFIGTDKHEKDYLIRQMNKILQKIK